MRYFRIIFNSGKLNIKEDKSKGKMRSFLLKDLISVEINGLPLASVVDKVLGQTKLLSKEDITNSDFCPS